MALQQMTAEELERMRVKAAESRRAQSAALAEVTAGTPPVADALAGTDPRLFKVKVRRVLLAVPGIGGAKADRYLAVAGVDPDRRVKGLAAFPKQRERLTGALAA